MGANGFFQANQLLVAHTKLRFFEPRVSFGEIDHQRVQNMVLQLQRGVTPSEVPIICTAFRKFSTL